MQRLRLLTRIYDVPLMFDEVQTGWGATGRMWAHELFDLPRPPDVVIWAKKAQNGVLFVSEELATFFQEEKKFNTTWEGDSVGMVRLLALLDKIDLDQVRRTGALARAGLDALAETYSRPHRERARRRRHAGVRRAAHRLARCAARSRLPARPRAAAGRRAHAALLSALRHRALRDRRGTHDSESGRRGHRRGRGRAVTAGAGDPRRLARVPARSARVVEITRRTSTSTEAQIMDSRDRALRVVQTVSAGHAASRRTDAAAAAARDARGHALEPTGHWRGPARSGERTPRGVRRSEARSRITTKKACRRTHASATTTRSISTQRRRCHRCRTTAEIENHAARTDSHPGTGRRLRVHLRAHRGARAPDGPGLAAARRR